MNTIRRFTTTAYLVLLALAFLLQPRASLASDEAAAGNAAALREKYAAERERMEHGPFGRPLALDSRDDNGALKGDAYVVLSHPFARASSGLGSADHWCDVLMLPFNTKKCEAGASDGASRLTLFVGRKTQTPLEEAFKLDFTFRVVARSADYLQLELACEQGPMGTKGYRIVFEAVPLDDKRSFIHLRYAYSYGTMSKVAMQAYLSTSGASKVGFSTEGADENGKPRLVGGMRGIMERNTMRYALAIDAYLGSLGAPEPARVGKLINDWFSATERYPRQLHEIDRGDYVAMKEKEFARMKGAG